MYLTNGFPVVSLEIPSIFLLPESRNGYFTGREDDLGELRSKLFDRRNGIHNHTVALSGLGGVGKTELAREYCYRSRDDYRYIFWVNGMGTAQLLQDFCSMAMVSGWAEKNEPNPKTVMKSFWFGWFRIHVKWLLVVDNLDQPIEHRRADTPVRSL